MLNILLEADELDTLSHTVIREIKVTETNNLHRGRRFDITKILQTS